MKKIPSLFKRDFDNKAQIYNEVSEGCEWVPKGEGIARRKYDGTCCLLKDGKLYKRREVKKGKSEPAGFILADGADPITGKRMGWVPVESVDRHHMEGLNNSGQIADGTYELIGPKINKNPEQSPVHNLIPHSETESFEHCPTSFNNIRDWFIDKDIEGIVWHHPDGRMCKIKKKDFGLKRGDSDE